VQREAEQNMLRQQQAEQMQLQRENMLAQRQRQQFEFEQAQQDRRRQLEQEDQFGKMADLIRQNGLDPDDPKVLSQFAEAAMVSRQPQLASFVTSMAERAAKRRAAATEARQIGDILGPPRLPPGPPLQPGAQQNALAGPAPMANALAAPQPDLLAGTPYSIGPVAPPAPPQAPAAVAPSDNAAKIAQLENQRDALEALGTPAALTQAKRLDRQLEKLQPKDQIPKLSDRLVPVGKLVFDRETRQFITPPAAAIAATQERGAAAPAKEPAAKPLTAAQEAARRDKLGKEFKSASSALQTTQDVLDSIAAVKDSPGLSRATGFTGTMLPSFPEGQAAQAETRLANLKGKITALGKAAAAASGAIGSIANQEWKILADQIAAIDPVKGTGPLLEQIGLVEAQALGAMERIQDAYNRQFGEDFERFPQFKDLPPPKSTQPKGRKSGGAVTPAGAAPAPAATGALSPAEQAELEQLRKRFGKGG
jgi:hypothetical protein